MAAPVAGDESFGRELRFTSDPGLPPTVAPPVPAPGTGHMPGMGPNGGHFYTLEVRPSRHDPGRFTWAIRDRGKLVRGSYRPHASEGAARAVALVEIERLIGQDGA